MLVGPRTTIVLPMPLMLVAVLCIAGFTMVCRILMSRLPQSNLIMMVMLCFVAFVGNIRTALSAFNSGMSIIAISVRICRHTINPLSLLNAECSFFRVGVCRGQRARARQTGRDLTGELKHLCRQVVPLPSILLQVLRQDMNFSGTVITVIEPGLFISHRMWIERRSQYGVETEHLPLVCSVIPFSFWRIA